MKLVEGKLVDLDSSFFVGMARRVFGCDKKG